MTRITFAGRRNVFSSGAESQVRAALGEILREDVEFEFYSGHRGEFDELCERDFLSFSSPYFLMMY